MRIVSVNAWGGAVFDVFADWLPRCAADVVCLQEVTRTAGVHGWTRFQDAERALPQRANLFDDVCSLLPQHHGTFVASDAGPFDVLGAIGLTDLVGTADTRTSRYTKPVRHANYMLVSDPEKVDRFEISMAPEVSDHRALILDC